MRGQLTAGPVDEMAHSGDPVREVFGKALRQQTEGIEATEVSVDGVNEGDKGGALSTHLTGKRGAGHERRQRPQAAEPDSPEKKPRQPAPPRREPLTRSS